MTPLGKEKQQQDGIFYVENLNIYQVSMQNIEAKHDP